MTQRLHRLMLVGLGNNERLLSSTVRSAGYLPLAFSNSAQALTHLRSQSVDLIVVDSSLRNPEYVCRKLRQHTSVPLLFLLSSCELAILSSSITEDIDRFIFKPLSMAETLAHIHSLLRRASWAHNQENFVSGDFTHSYQETHAVYPSL